MVTFKEVDNIKELANLASLIWHEYWPGRISCEQIDYMVDKFQSEEAITKQIENENYTYFYLVVDGNIAGYTGLSKKENYLFLSKIYIGKNYRHKGVGTAAFEFIKKFAKENNYKTIKLTVQKDHENSISAYIKWGFKTVDAIVANIGNGFVMDDYVMEYYL